MFCVDGNLARSQLMSLVPIRVMWINKIPPYLFTLLIDGSLFLIGCLNLLPIYVSFRKRIAPRSGE